MFRTRDETATKQCGNGWGGHWPHRRDPTRQRNARVAAAAEREAALQPVGWRFLVLYTLAAATFLVKLFTGHVLAMFLVPCLVGGLFILLFAATLTDRRLDRADRPAWSARDAASTFWVDPRRSPDFAWAFASRFLFVLAFAFLTTYQAYYLLNHLGSAESAVAQQVFAGTVVQSVVLVAASLLAGTLSDRTGRRKVFVVTAASTYGLAMFVIAAASSFNGFLVGMAVAGLGFGMYMAVDLALVVDVLPSPDTAAKDLGVAVAGLSAVLAAGAILPVRRVR